MEPQGRPVREARARAGERLLRGSGGRRRGLGIELCHRYFLDGAAYCKAAEQEMSMPGLFDVMKKETA